MGASTLRRLFFVRYWFLALAWPHGALSAEESPWLKPEAMKSIMEELIHHFKNDGTERKTTFTERLKQRLYFYQNELRPIYTSLPKNSHGHLETPDVGKALHSLFLRLYQMHLRGLASLSDTTEGASAAAKVEGFVESAIKQGLAIDGFTNRELSVFAVAIEHLIHEETRGLIVKVFEMLSLPTDETTDVPVDQGLKVLDAYLVFLLARSDAGAAYDVTTEALETARKSLETRGGSWCSGCLAKLNEKLALKGSGLKFPGVLAIAEEFEQELGKMHEKSVCDERKKAVLASATCDTLTGRIPFSALGSAGFGKSLSPDSEEKVYYRDWLMGVENFIVRKDFYSISCQDPCEGILSKVEQEASFPRINRAQAASMVANARSPTDLTDFLKKLAADGDDKTIDIHGKDFDSFLQYAAPCECSRATTGTVSSQSSTPAPAEASTDLKPEETTVPPADSGDLKADTPPESQEAPKATSSEESGRLKPDSSSVEPDSGHLKADSQQETPKEAIPEDSGRLKPDRQETTTEAPAPKADYKNMFPELSAKQAPAMQPDSQKKPDKDKPDLKPDTIERKAEATTTKFKLHDLEEMSSGRSIWSTMGKLLGFLILFVIVVVGLSQWQTVAPMFGVKPTAYGALKKKGKGGNVDYDCDLKGMV